MKLKKKEQFLNTMFSLIKKILNGTINTNSTESSGEKEIKMVNIKTNIPEFDKENESLLTASKILESLGNSPNPTAAQLAEKVSALAAEKAKGAKLTEIINNSVKGHGSDLAKVRGEEAAEKAKSKVLCSFQPSP